MKKMSIPRKKLYESKKVLVKTKKVVVFILVVKMTELW